MLVLYIYMSVSSHKVKLLMTWQIIRNAKVRVITSVEL